MQCRQHRSYYSLQLEYPPEADCNSVLDSIQFEGSKVKVDQN